MSFFLRSRTSNAGSNSPLFSDRKPAHSLIFFPFCSLFWSIGFYLRFAVSIIHEITTVLEIYFFSLVDMPRRSARTVQCRSSQPPLEHADVPNTSTNTGTTTSGKKKGTRGCTRNLKLLNLPNGVKVKLDWNDINQPIGQFVSDFANECGIIVRHRDNAPLQVPSFKEIPPEKKIKMIDLLMDKFEFERTAKREEYIMRSMASKYSEHRCTLRKAYLLYDNDSDRLANPPDEVVKEDWVWLVRYWGSDEFKKLSERNTANRNKLVINHCTGSKSFANVENDEKSLAGGQAPTRLRMFELTHNVKNPGAAELLDKFDTSKRQFEEDGQQLTDSVENEIYTLHMPPERPGRVRGIGLAIQPKRARQEASQRIQQENEKLRGEVESLKGQVAELQGMKGDMKFVLSAIHAMYAEKGVPPPTFPPRFGTSSQGSVPPSTRPTSPDESINE